MEPEKSVFLVVWALRNADDEDVEDADPARPATSFGSSCPW